MNKRRAYIILLALILAAIAILVRLIDLQIINYSFYKDRAEHQRQRIIKLAADRGDILDRNGRILATSLDSFSIHVNPRRFSSVEALSKLLQEKVGPFDKRKLFAWVKRKLDAQAAKRVEEAGLPGVYILSEKKRIYPKGHLASQVVGFVGMDNEGLSGMELSQDKSLKGNEGQIVTESDPMGYELLAVREKGKDDAAPGMNLTLTIDETIQYISERALERTIKEFQAVSGCIIVMDAKNGEVLALAGKPDFDPNQYSKFPPERWKSFANDVFEPGSTFKVITTAAGLDERVIGLDTRLNALDSFTIGGKVIKNSHQIDWKGSYISVSRMLEQSINTGALQISLKLGPDRFYKKIKDFGFGELLSIGLPGGSKGILKHPKDWYKPDIAMMAFGQSLAVTPTQLISAFQSIANGGRRIRPTLIKRIESLDGSFVKTNSVSEINRPITQKTAEELSGLLENVVLYGSGKRTKMTNYRVGGKTGTAQKAVHGVYSKGRFIASFCGFAPLSDPAVVALVIINEPKTSIWGESVAGPTFKEVVENSLRYLNVPPDVIK